MHCCCGPNSPFETTLHYSSPAHGGWGVVRMGHLLPESYQLFVSPAACGRHGAIGAYMQGRKQRVSYLYLEEDDIVSGGYEELIADAAIELLEHLEHAGKLPKVLMIFVSCIDDLLGTDHEAIVQTLSEKRPDVRFTFCHMNPISMDTNVPPPVNIQNKIYSTLDPVQEKDAGINLLGNLVPLRKTCEFFDLAAQMGAGPVRHVTDYQTFAQFQEMAKSQRNLVITPAGKYSAEQMQKKHGIPYTMALVSYDPEEVTRTYQGIAKALGVPCPDTSAYEEACHKAMEETAKLLQGMPVVLDSEAAVRPFDFARGLLKHGFQVKRVLVQKVIPSDREAYAWVQQYAPDLSVQQPQHHKAVRFEDRLPDCLAVGYNSGYLTGSQHVVAADGQQGLFGYQGILDMMQMLREAASRTADLKGLIDAAGLVV